MIFTNDKVGNFGAFQHYLDVGVSTKVYRNFAQRVFQLTLNWIETTVRDSSPSQRNTCIDHNPASELFPYLSKNAIFLILNFNSTNLKPTLLSAIFT